MDHSKFKEIENKYMELKSSMDSGTLSSDELKVRLKKMMIRDDDGSYWMIGSNTGKWYVYNGTDWKEKDPYSEIDLAKTQNFENISNETLEVQHEKAEEEEKILIEEDESENESIELDSGNEETIIKESGEESAPVHVSADTLCIICKSKLDPHSVYCSNCGANQKELGSKRSKSGEELLIRSIRITSLIFFFGGLGLIAGVIFGATFGIFDIFGDLMSKFPEMLAETRGKIQGGLIFAALGGIGGFFGFALFFGLSGLIYNAFSYLFGGIRIRTR